MAKIKPEVLSPAGSFESLVAAVRSGADAVYLGAREFSARRNAENFDGDDLDEVVSYCHLRGVKVYLTLNTLLRQKEISSALKTAEKAYRAGVDGIIVQDIGFARLLHAAMPDFPLHASTQMSVHSPAALKWLKEAGFSRVVTAREMSAAALKKFCAAARELDIEVEVFVHGALCMSVSGQCLLSAVLGARSGNRGLCAGPCRLPFEALGGTGFDLSLKDLSLFPHIEDLAQMGVASLKIEGRMKRPEYVAAATAACRAAVDEGDIPKNITDSLRGVFSRSGFTDGYFKNQLGRDMFGTRTKDDVLESKETFAGLHELYRGERQSIGIDISGEFKAGYPARLKLICGEHSVEVFGEEPQKAQNRATAKEDIAAALSKLGATPYYCSKISIAADEDIFIRNSALNSLRRDAIEKLDSERKQISIGKILPTEDIVADTRQRPEKQLLVAKISDLSQAEAAKEADFIAFPAELDIPEGIEPEKLWAELPRWIENEASLRERLAEIKAAGINRAICGNLSAVALAQEAGMEIIADIGMNIYNDHALKTAAEMGIGAAILSAETTAAELRDTRSAIPIGVFAYGRLPLMLLKNCPLKNGRPCRECDKKGSLRDRRGVKFPVRCRAGYSQLLNSTPVFLADKLQDIKNADMLYLYFADESPEEIGKIIQSYRHGGEFSGEFTRGLTFRPSL